MHYGENELQSHFQPKYKYKSQFQLSLSQLSTQEETETDLFDHENFFYTGKIGVGNDSKLFNQIFDTGSGTLFVNSVLCRDEGCLNGNRYDYRESDEHEDLLEEVTVVFGSGTLKGIRAKDTVYVGDFVIPDTQFLEITEQVGEAFREGEFDGLVGLAFPELQDEKGLFDFMIDAQVIDDRVFSFYMNRQNAVEGSKITFGGWDSSLTDEEITYHQVRTMFFWTIQATGFKIGNKQTDICTAADPCWLIVDSGTSLISAPTYQLSKIMSEIPQDCEDKYANMPNLTFIIDDKEYIIEPNEYMIGVNYKGEMQEMYEDYDKSNYEDCAMAIFAMDMFEDEPNAWILGDTFMTKYLTIFDRSTRQVGFGKVNTL